MFEFVFSVFDIERVHFYIVWLILTYASLMFSMFIDLVTGYNKAKKAGIFTTSRLLRKSCDKSKKYFLPMLCLMPVDILASLFLPFPVFTTLMASFNIFCEWKSVMEKTHTKKEIHEAANTVSVIVKNKDDLAQVFAEVLGKMGEEEKPTP